MGRVLIRDEYQAERWVEEGQLCYAPWRDCEVIRRDPEPDDTDSAGEQVEPVPPAPSVPGAVKPAKPKPAE